jgi:hypothetical protein
MNHVQPLLAAVRRILRPLVRILLRHGVPYPVFSDLARWIYVDVAAQEFGIARRKQTNSRISVLTGLSRKEVLRLRRLQVGGDQASVERFHRAARIVSAWAREPDFQDEAGQPRALPFDGPGTTFSLLVARHGGDVPPRAVLDELLRVDAIERDNDGMVRLRMRSYVPSGTEADAERLAILGTDVAALVETIDHNLQAEPGQRFFQRKVAYRSVPAGSVPRVKELAYQESQRLLELLDHLLAEQTQGGTEVETGHTPQTKRVMLGIYWFEDDEPDEPAAH